MRKAAETQVPFLSSYKATQTRAKAQCSLSDPQLVSGALIDVAKHLGNLAFRVWEKMKEKVHFSPVILDPNTAHPRLYLSDDLTSVRRGDTDQQLPNNPERNTNYANVLGSEGFSSGKHSWEVEVGDHRSWIVGLVKESVDRKGECPASPEYGFWCLWHRDGKYTNGLSQTVTVKKSLQRIRVQLDYDRGEVSFYNSEDMTHIYTHRDTFTEKPSHISVLQKLTFPLPHPNVLSRTSPDPQTVRDAMEKKDMKNQRLLMKPALHPDLLLLLGSSQPDRRQLITPSHFSRYNSSVGGRPAVYQT
ncbi:zinc-binding protein A33-like [Mugil cephalus]|uniref:zinc-binding protein A33-like n=1 Tax=Mugil cephalus TaxID=48193 RepID=UPI001FB67C67|nr:zinc-binding protein A33-like [Mugil cephalus]